MDNLSSNLSYDEGWKEAEVPVQNSEQDDLPEQPPKKCCSKPAVLIFQLTICVLLVLAAYIIKLFGGVLYEDIHSWYQTELNDEIILNSDFESFNLDKSFAEAAD